MKDQIRKLMTVNGQPINFVIGQYRERKELNGLAEFFNAFLEDLLALEEHNDMEKLSTEIENMKIIEDAQLTFYSRVIHGEKADGLMEGYNKALDEVLKLLDELHPRKN